MSMGWPEKVDNDFKKYYKEKRHEKNPFISGILRHATVGEESLEVWHGLC
ncbi:MAG: hypothetical protein ACFFBV_16220 [Promethearchaeota archaeon]